jgi:hypothetical protein
MSLYSHRHNSRPTAQVARNNPASRIEMIAFYAAFTLIAAVVFGTLSIRPF